MKENQNVEWKQSWRDEYLKWICGFANAQGGTLEIGKNDRGVVVGLTDAARLLEDIPNKVRDILGMVVPVNLHHDDAKEWLEIVVDPYPSPISYKGEYHYRSGSTKQELKGAALDKFLLRKQGRHWDSVPVPYVAVGDLETKTLAFFRKHALKSQRLSPEILDEADQSLLDKLHLLDGAYLKRAAVLLFHPDSERFITGAYLKIGFFENNVDLRHQDEVHGDLFLQVNRAIEILNAKYLKAWISYEGLQRDETYPVPEPALREAILNAVVHKDYGSAIPIQISVYPDKLMIWNPGQLPPEWTVEHLLDKHSSQPFNPDVANAFFRAGMIESWGRGIEKITETCKIAGVPTPELRCEPTGLWMIFHFVPPPSQNRGPSGKATQEATQETTQETTQEKILKLLENKPSITRKELATLVGISSDGIKYHLEKMKSDGYIRHVGSTKAGFWDILK